MKQDMEDALQAVASMLERSEKAQGKFAQGTSQYTLQKNRIHALHIAFLLIKNESEENTVPAKYRKEDLETALAPIASLISKSEKALQKLTKGTWQHTMLERNLKALHIASPLLQKALRSL